MKIRSRTPQMLMVSAGRLSFETIERAAIRAERIAAGLNRKVNARMSAPVDVLWHGAMQRQIGIADFDHALGIDMRFAHLDDTAQTGVSQSRCAGVRP